MVRSVVLKKSFCSVGRRLIKFRLRPIRVVCFHQVSEEFDEESMRRCDWMSSRSFQEAISRWMKEGYRFISLDECYNHLRRDFFRYKKYAVLTADDGSALIKNVIPWLTKNNIPLTLFVNGKYLNGQFYRESPSEQYLLEGDLLECLRNDMISVESHGFDHLDASNVSRQMFGENVQKDVVVLNELLAKAGRKGVAFYAYPWGRHNRIADSVLSEMGLVPVLMDGMDNIDDSSVIHRRILV